MDWITNAWGSYNYVNMINTGWQTFTAHVASSGIRPSSGYLSGETSFVSSVIIGDNLIYGSFSMGYYAQVLTVSVNNGVVKLALNYYHSSNEKPSSDGRNANYQFNASNRTYYWFAIG